MTANLIGTWDGTLLYPSVLLSALRISIVTQSADEKVGSIIPRVVATLSGHIQLGGWDSKGNVGYEEKTPFAGFVDDAVLIKLCLYQTTPESSTSSSVYAGRLTTQQLALSIISGKTGSSRFFGDTFGNTDPGPPTFTVKRLGWDLGNRTFVRTYDHVPF